MWMHVCLYTHTHTVFALTAITTLQLSLPSLSPKWTGLQKRGRVWAPVLLDTSWDCAAANYKAQATWVAAGCLKQVSLHGGMDGSTAKRSWQVSSINSSMSGLRGEKTCVYKLVDNYSTWLSLSLSHLGLSLPSPSTSWWRHHSLAQSPRMLICLSTTSLHVQ